MLEFRARRVRQTRRDGARRSRKAGLLLVRPGGRRLRAPPRVDCRIVGPIRQSRRRDVSAGRRPEGRRPLAATEQAPRRLGLVLSRGSARGVAPVGTGGPARVHPSGSWSSRCLQRRERTSDGWSLRALHRLAKRSSHQRHGAECCRSSDPSAPRRIASSCAIWKSSVLGRRVISAPRPESASRRSSAGRADACLASGPAEICHLADVAAAVRAYVRSISKRDPRQEVLHEPHRPSR